MKSVKPTRYVPVSGIPLGTLSGIVDSMTVTELKATEKDVQRVFKGWRK